MKTTTLTMKPPRRGLHMITAEVAKIVEQSGVKDGLCNLFIQHTSASLIINENYDPDVRTDLEAFMDRLAPDGDPMFRHTIEGPDDMPSHIKMALTQVSLTIPVQNGKLALGTWQGIYLWEHRTRPSPRTVLVTVF